MYVCVCRAVTDDEVLKAIDQGADDLDSVAHACGAGGDCGACRDVICEMLEERRGGSGAKRLPLAPERAA